VLGSPTHQSREVGVLVVCPSASVSAGTPTVGCNSQRSGNRDGVASWRYDRLGETGSWRSFSPDETFSDSIAVFQEYVTERVLSTCAVYLL